MNNLFNKLLSDPPLPKISSHQEFSELVNKQMLKQVQHDGGEKHRIAFTLAEVLITLTIIGVIAALTIPNLMVKHEKQVTVTKLKKVYSTLSQAVDTSIAENGPISSWNISAYGDDIDIKHDFLKKYIFNYLKVAKDCGHERCTNIEPSSCRKYLNGKSDVYGWSRYPYANTFILEDGTFVFVHWGDTSNVYNFMIYVDINYDAKPNVFGKDVFVFNFDTKNNKVYPWGAYSTRNQLVAPGGWSSCSHTSSGQAGMNCAGLIIKDGWKISDDYPW